MEEHENSEVNGATPDLSPQEALPFVEVICAALGKTRRFAFGTEAGFALNLINRKLEREGIVGTTLASHIEAVKEGEEPVSFGPNSLLVNYGNGWKLQTANDIEGIVKGNQAGTSSRRTYTKVEDDPYYMTEESQSPSAVSLLYIAKIFLAFILLFIFGAIFTLALENLPHLILYINSSA